MAPRRHGGRPTNRARHVFFAVPLVVLAPLLGGCRAILGIGNPDVIDASTDASNDVVVTRDARDGEGGGGKEAGSSCTAQATRCDGNAIETCGGDGQWGSPSPCQNQVCVVVSGSAACVECVPGHERCAGAGFLTCTSNGTWGPVTACVDQTCVQTSTKADTTAGCIGSCAPDQTRCDTTMTGVETCSGDGVWGASKTCSGSTCVTSTGDAGSSASCQGSCSPGQMTCSGNSVETCVAGMFGNAQPCGKMACITTDGVSACAGECMPGTYQCGTGQQPQECNSSGMWVDNGTACTTNTCVPGATPSCEGTCIAGQGGSCNCSTGTEFCSSDGTPGACQLAPETCLAGSTSNCNTCGTLAGFGTGSQTCSTTTCTEGDCYPPTGTSWSVNGNPATGFTHVCGSSLSGNDWYYAEEMGGNFCEVQAGPNATLSAGRYTATFTIASSCTGSSCPAQGTAVGAMQVGHGSPETTDASMSIPLGMNSPATYALPFRVTVDCTTQYTFRVFANFPSSGSYTLDITGTSLTYNGPPS